MDRSLQGATRSLGPAMLSLALAAAASAQTLLTASGQPGDFNLGVAVSRVGDVNGDGHDDFIAGATQHIPNLSTEPGTGVARIYSGKDGAVLFTFHGDAAGDQFGQTVSWGR